MTQTFRFRAVGGSAALATALLQLGGRVPSLGVDFIQATSTIINREEYGAFIIDHDSGHDGKFFRGSLVGIGLLCVYQDHFHDVSKLAVEAAWFDPELAAEAQLEAWVGLLTLADRDRLQGLYLKLESITPREPLEALLQTGRNGSLIFRRESKALMQAKSEGIWSAFMGKTRKSATFVDCVRVQQPVEISLAGVRSGGPDILFRGEGRVAKPPYANCSSLPALVAHVHDNGFAARAVGAFGGSLVEQILHQGYVSSPTVSLTSDHKVAAAYGTAAGTRGPAAIFAIDASVIGTDAPVWDSFESMRLHHPAFLDMDFKSLVKLAQAFSVQEAGQILEGMFTGLRRRKQEYEDTLGLQKDAPAYIDPSVVERASMALSEEEFGSLCSILEFSCPHDDRGFVGEAIVATPYGAAFHMALPELKRALEQSADNVWRHPGWDTTVFGYITKTCRDKEFFSSGDIPPAAIKEAHIVDVSGRVHETIVNPHYACVTK